MASIQRDPSGNFHISFRFGGKRFKRSLKTKHERKAESAATHVEENIRLVEAGRLLIPGEADIPTFLMSDGQLCEKPIVETNITLGKLFAEYEASLPIGSLEPMTLEIAAIHMRHVSRVLGSSKLLRTITKKDLQHYVTTRSKEPGHRGNLSATTIRKELGTFSAIWNWAVGQGYAKGVFPRRGLIYPKQADKPPFQTWSQIERQIEDQDLPEGEESALWECLYLNNSETDELLEFLKTESRYPFLHPMATIAAHTGARRSELCRIKTTDIDLNDGRLTIRELKRVKSKKTMRSIPMSKRLHETISEWLATKTKSPYLFPEDHRIEKHRRDREEEGYVTPYEAGYHLKQVLRESDWSNVKGWHVFRHSFISQCASNGIDQRFIDAWVGHQTDEQRLRYRHLFPDSQRAAIDSMFSS